MLKLAVGPNHVGIRLLYVGHVQYPLQRAGRDRRSVGINLQDPVVVVLERMVACLVPAMLHQLRCEVAPLDIGVAVCNTPRPHLLACRSVLLTHRARQHNGSDQPFQFT